MGVRDDLYITVPSFFRCPISLDVMKSPVSLCTGVTYDRSSIQRWLDSGNNTCPATMQVLQNKDFVPNRTLQRLIQIWSDSLQHHHHHLPHPLNNSASSASVPSLEEVKTIVSNFKTKAESSLADNSSDGLSRILCFAAESEENKSVLARTEGLVPMLVDFLGRWKSVESVELVVRLLDAVSGKIGDQQQLMRLILKNENADSDALSGLVLVLQQGRLNSRIGSVKILESMAIDAESKLLVAEKNGSLLPELVKSICLETDPSLIEASLSCLIAISMTKRVKLQLLQLKVIPELRKLLTAKGGSNTITEKALKLLDAVSSCKEGREEVCRDTVLLEAVVGKVLKVSSEATEHAVTILWSVCYLFRDENAQEAGTRSNGLTKMLLLMQSNCSPAVRQMSSDLLKIFRVNSKSCLSVYDTKTTHIMPF